MKDTSLKGSPLRLSEKRPCTCFSRRCYLVLSGLDFPSYLVWRKEGKFFQTRRKVGIGGQSVPVPRVAERNREFVMVILCAKHHLICRRSRQSPRRRRCGYRLLSLFLFVFPDRPDRGTAGGGDRDGEGHLGVDVICPSCFFDLLPAQFIEFLTPTTNS